MSISFPYPPHISDPLRRKIAEDYLSHEFRKFFSNIQEKETWNVIDNEIRTWFDGHYTFAPIRDFWNGLHGISRGFKLKNIVSWLTSENIAWREKTIELEKLYFGVNFQEFQELPPRPNAKEVHAFITSLPKGKLAAINKHHLEERSHKNNVDAYPIIAIQREEKVIVSDGNRRLFKAVLMGYSSILCAFGEVTGEPAIYNEWVPTSLLLDLIGLHRATQERGNVNSEAIAEVITSFIRNSQSGKYEFFERSINRHFQKDLALEELVKEKLH